jgi:hypothetical protein
MTLHFTVITPTHRSWSLNILTQLKESGLFREVVNFKIGQKKYKLVFKYCSARSKKIHRKKRIMICQKRVGGNLIEPLMTNAGTH